MVNDILSKIWGAACNPNIELSREQLFMRDMGVMKELVSRYPAIKREMEEHIADLDEMTSYDGYLVSEYKRSLHSLIALLSFSNDFECKGLPPLVRAYEDAVRRVENLREAG